MFVCWISKKLTFNRATLPHLIMFFFLCESVITEIENESNLVAACGSFQNDSSKHCGNYQGFIYFTGVYRWHSVNMSISIIKKKDLTLFNCLQCIFVEKPSSKSQRQSWIWAPACFPTQIFLFVNLRKKGVSHERHRDALWMITPNWSMKVHYACLDLHPAGQEFCYLLEFHILGSVRQEFFILFFSCCGYLTAEHQSRFTDGWFVSWKIRSTSLMPKRYLQLGIILNT